MNVIDAINTRRSIRGFKADPVPGVLLKEILETATRAPSALNSQPWEFAVITGPVLDQIRAANVEKLRNGAPMAPDHVAALWPKESVYRERQVELAKQIFNLMGIAREDKENRSAWQERGFRFFDAPAAIIVMTDQMLSESGPLLDIGMVVENICLAAVARGLGTCIEDQGIFYPEVIRNLAGIPETKRLIIGIAVGYPDRDHAANQLKTPRAPVDQITTWIGFDE
ncbi:MAG: nitroreductase [Desulfobacterales bacterium]|nr:nitroreductase [Desulfobacterales bacterium]